MPVSDALNLRISLGASVMVSRGNGALPPSVSSRSQPQRTATLSETFLSSPHSPRPSSPSGFGRKRAIATPAKVRGTHDPDDTDEPVHQAAPPPPPFVSPPASTSTGSTWSVFPPQASSASARTSYVPGTVNVWDGGLQLAL